VDAKLENGQEDAKMANRENDKTKFTKVEIDVETKLQTMQKIVMLVYLTMLNAHNGQQKQQSTS